MFSPASAPASEIIGLSMLYLAMTGVIFVTVSSLLVYAVINFRRRRDDDDGERAWIEEPDVLEPEVEPATAR
jgi:heme/copper-type cytochrome/quinol oxidase subunit 2